MTRVELKGVSPWCAARARGGGDGDEVRAKEGPGVSGGRDRVPASHGRLAQTIGGRRLGRGLVSVWPSKNKTCYEYE